MIRATPFATVAFVAAAVVCAVATTGLSGPTRTAALAVAGTVLVTSTEVAFRLAHRRRWVLGGDDVQGSLPALRDIGPAVVLSVVGGVAAWLTIDAAGAAPIRSWAVLVAGGVAAVVAVLAAVAVPTTARQRRGTPPASSTGRRGPWRRGRPSGRGTTPAPPRP